MSSDVEEDAWPMPDTSSSGGPTPGHGRLDPTTGVPAGTKGTPWVPGGPLPMTEEPREGG